MKNLHDVYHAQLQDSYSACKQSLEVTAEMAEATGNDELKKALTDATDGITDGMNKLASLCANHDIDPTKHFCKGMQGLAEEAREHALKEDFEDNDARDAMIITQYQRMAHYAIAAYGCLKAFANRLELDGEAATLDEMLDSCYDGDRRMTMLAVGPDGINAEAA